MGVRAMDRTFMLLSVVGEFSPKASPGHAKRGIYVNNIMIGSQPAGQAGVLEVREAKPQIALPRCFCIF